MLTTRNTVFAYPDSQEYSDESTDMKSPGLHT